MAHASNWHDTLPIKSRRVDAHTLECIASTRALSEIRKLGERRRSAGLVSPKRPGHQQLGSGGKGFEKGDLSGRIEDHEVRNRSLSGRTPEGTILEIRMMPRIVVVQMLCRDGHPKRGTKFQQKRCAAGRHEADGDIGTNQQGDQHQASE
jgi:hypothetical protein